MYSPPPPPPHCRQASRSYTDSPDEAKSAENTLTKGHKIKRRFTFTRTKSPSKSGAGNKRNSEAAITQSAEFSSVLFRRRKPSTSKGIMLLSKRDSSDESSLNWSIPSDLPGVVEGRMDRGSMENMFADDEEIRARCQSTPTIAERSESRSSIEVAEMRVSRDGVITTDVGVQVNTREPFFQFPDVLQLTSSDLYRNARNGRSPPTSRSVPQSPYTTNPRRLGLPGPRVVSWGREATGDAARFGRKTTTTAMQSSPQLWSRSNGHCSTEVPRKENVS